MSAKNPYLTRASLLEAGFQEVYEHGFRSASIESILARAGVTKGALYHHFPNKQALGYALVEEVIGGFVAERWRTPLQDADDPITVLQQLALGVVEEDCDNACTRGCPLNNLAQEMSNEDEGFRQRVEAVYTAWQEGVADALRRGQASGTVRADIDPDRISAFYVAVSSGIMGAAKRSQDPKVMHDLIVTSNEFLETLRALPLQ